MKLKPTSSKLSRLVVFTGVEVHKSTNIRITNNLSGFYVINAHILKSEIHTKTIENEVYKRMDKMKTKLAIWYGVTKQ